MCWICRQNPCHPACPNAVPTTVYTCEQCGEPIIEGVEYVEVDGEYYHEDCFTDNAAEILLKQPFVTKGIAEVG